MLTTRGGRSCKGPGGPRRPPGPCPRRRRPKPERSENPSCPEGRIKQQEESRMALTDRQGQYVVIRACPDENRYLHWHAPTPSAICDTRSLRTPASKGRLLCRRSTLFRYWKSVSLGLYSTAGSGLIQDRSTGNMPAALARFLAPGCCCFDKANKKMQEVPYVSFNSSHCHSGVTARRSAADVPTAWRTCHDG